MSCLQQNEYREMALYYTSVPLAGKMMDEVVGWAELVPKAWCDTVWMQGHGDPELFLKLPLKWCMQLWGGNGSLCPCQMIQSTGKQETEFKDEWFGTCSLWSAYIYIHKHTQTVV